MYNAYIFVNPVIGFFMRCTYNNLMDRTTNLLGALSLALSDRIKSSLKEVLGRSGESAAALMVIGYAPGLSVESLRQVLERSHPGTVRLIDRLVDDGLVERRKADDGRAVALHVTRKGGRQRTKLIDKRLDTLEHALDGLSERERTQLGDLLAKLLTSLPGSEMDKHRICRLCSVRVCTECPIPGNAPEFNRAEV